MSDQEQIQPCVQCHKHHEQMLMLSCMHDPCIDCAAIRYVQNAPKNSQFYPCSLCSEQTQLDSSSVIELQRVYRKLRSQDQSKKYHYGRNTPSYNKQALTADYSAKNSLTHLNDKSQTFQPYTYKKTSAFQHKPVNMDLPQYNRSESTTLLPGRKAYQPLPMCKQHPQDQLTYFCFSCNEPICPQCAIHGSHREHEVQTTRKAIKQIKRRLGEKNSQISSEVGQLINKKQQQRRLLKTLAEQNKKDLDIIKKQFNALKNLLVEKQKEFIIALNENYQQNCQEINMQGGKLDKLTEEYDFIRKGIDNTLKKDDLSVLMEFNSREEDAQHVLDKNRQLGQQTDIVGLVAVNHQAMEKELRELADILQSMRINTLTYNSQQ